MKKLYFLFSLLLSWAAKGQVTLKIYAWSQEVTAGTIRKDVNTQKQTAVNYYIFAEYNAPAAIRFNDVWIRGKNYKTQNYPVDSTPVINTNDDIPGKPVKHVLVPATRLKVISIVPLGSPGSSQPRGAWFREMAGRAELIVSYSYHGKTYYTTVKKIKLLPPAAGV